MYRYLTSGSSFSMQNTVDKQFLCPHLSTRKGRLKLKHTHN